MMDQECPVNPEEELVEISDQTAQLVLGEGNMEEWNHARFTLSLNIMYWYVFPTSLCLVQAERNLVPTQAVARLLTLMTSRLH